MGRSSTVVLTLVIVGYEHKNWQQRHGSTCNTGLDRLFVSCALKAVSFVTWTSEAVMINAVKRNPEYV